MFCFLWLPFLGLIFLSQEQASVPRDKSGAGFFFFFDCKKKNGAQVFHDDESCVGGKSIWNTNTPIMMCFS